MDWRTLALQSKDLNGNEKTQVTDPPPWSDTLSIHLLDRKLTGKINTYSVYWNII